MNNNVRDFYKNGKLVIDVNYKTTVGCTVMCVDNGLWYKFKVESVEELEDNNYRITSTSLIGIDEKLITN